MRIQLHSKGFASPGYQLAGGSCVKKA